MARCFVLTLVAVVFGVAAIATTFWIRGPALIRRVDTSALGYEYDTQRS
jgi:hypothetical protein